MHWNMCPHKSASLFRSSSLLYLHLIFIPPLLLFHRDPYVISNSHVCICVHMFVLEPVCVCVCLCLMCSPFKGFPSRVFHRCPSTEEETAASLGTEKRSLGLFLLEIERAREREFVFGVCSVETLNT